MRCPVCGCTKDRVLDTRPVDDERSVRRRRECLNCQHRFTSYEVVEKDTFNVIKRDGTCETFNRDKIMNGLKKACQKRPLSTRQMSAIVDEIESDLINSMRPEIPSTEIGERIMASLRERDEVAYIRFVSVYKKFDDIDSFLDELNSMKQMKEEKKRAEEQARLEHGRKK